MAEAATAKINRNGRIGPDCNGGTDDSGVTVKISEGGGTDRVTPSELEVIYEIVSVGSAQEMTRLRVDQARVVRAVAEWVARHAREALSD